MADWLSVQLKNHRRMPVEVGHNQLRAGGESGPGGTERRTPFSNPQIILQLSSVLFARLSSPSSPASSNLQDALSSASSPNPVLIVLESNYRPRSPDYETRPM